MIEIIQETAKTEDKTEARLPRNIRQIGNPEKDFRIYMEDYVYTYLHPAQMQGMEFGILPRLLILVGEIDHFSNRSCAFISGAIQVEQEGMSEELPELDERAWRQIHKEMQQYFDACEIVGWVLDIPGNTLAVTREMERVHQKNFSGKYQFFFLMDSREREEAFYTWKEGQLTRKEGYFIYYEKNPQMQEYMISRREAKYGGTPPVEEVKDQAAQNYRAMMLEKKERTYKHRTGFLSYLTSLLMVFVLCFVSVLLLGNIRRMETMEETISVMSAVREESEEPQESNAAQVAVETISSSVLPAGEMDTKQEAASKETAAETVIAETAPGMGQEAAAETAEQAAEETIEQPAAEQSGEQTAEQPEQSVPNTAEQPEQSVPNTAEQPEQSVPVTEEQPPADSAETAADTDAMPENSAADAPVMTEAEQYRAQGYYIVRAGDSLQKICYKIYQTYAVMDKLCEVNAIDNQDAIYIGQKLVLP